MIGLRKRKVYGAQSIDERKNKRKYFRTQIKSRQCVNSKKSLKTSFRNKVKEIIDNESNNFRNLCYQGVQHNFEQCKIVSGKDNHKTYMTDKGSSQVAKKSKIKQNQTKTQSLDCVKLESENQKDINPSRRGCPTKDLLFFNSKHKERAKSTAKTKQMKQMKAAKKLKSQNTKRRQILLSASLSESDYDSDASFFHNNCGKKRNKNIDKKIDFNMNQPALSISNKIINLRRKKIANGFDGYTNLVNMRDDDIDFNKDAQIKRMQQTMKISQAYIESIEDNSAMQYPLNVGSNISQLETVPFDEKKKFEKTEQTSQVKNKILSHEKSYPLIERKYAKRKADKLKFDNKLKYNEKSNHLKTYNENTSISNDDDIRMTHHKMKKVSDALSNMEIQALQKDTNNVDGFEVLCSEDESYCYIQGKENSCMSMQYEATERQKSTSHIFTGLDKSDRIVYDGSFSRPNRHSFSFNKNDFSYSDDVSTDRSFINKTRDNSNLLLNEDRKKMTFCETSLWETLSEQLSMRSSKTDKKKVFAPEKVEIDLRNKITGSRLTLKWESESEEDSNNYFIKQSTKDLKKLLSLQSSKPIFKGKMSKNNANRKRICSPVSSNDFRDHIFKLPFAKTMSINNERSNTGMVNINLLLDDINEFESEESDKLP